MTVDFKPIATPDGFAHSNSSTLLLGLGNDILCDDAIGLLVARALSERRQLASASPVTYQLPSDSPAIDIRETTELGLALLDHIIGYKKLIIIDAIQTLMAPPGYIHELDTPALTFTPVTTPRFLAIGDMITLGKQLALPVPEHLKIFAIEIQDPRTITDRLTPTLQTALPQIINHIWSAIMF